MGRHTDYAPPSAFVPASTNPPKRGKPPPPLTDKDIDIKHFGQQLSDLTQADMRSDLLGMGFEPKQVTQMMAKREMAVDGFAQLPFYSGGFVHKDPAMRPKTKVPLYRKIGSYNLPASYKHLVLDEGRPDWVLFDANIPASKYGKDKVHTGLVRWAQYKPGNKRILKYNTRSGSIGLQWTPDHFDDHDIDYSKNGPLLVRLTDHTCQAKVARRVRSKRADLVGHSDGVDGKADNKPYSQVQRGYRAAVESKPQIVQPSKQNDSEDSSDKIPTAAKAPYKDEQHSETASASKGPDSRPNPLLTRAEGSGRYVPPQEWAFLAVKPTGAPRDWRPLEELIDRSFRRK